MERLSSLDASTLRVEDRGLPMRAAALPYQPNARVLQCWMAVFARGTSGALSQLDALPVRTFGPV